MSMIHLSICLCHLQFLSSMSYSFQVQVFYVLAQIQPRYFILFDAVVNWIVFLISLSDNSLLVYRNATDFCILILYPATLLNSFISSNSFLLVSLGFSIYSITSCHLQTMTVLLPLFQLDSFYFFFLSDCCDYDFQYYIE